MQRSTGKIRPEHDLSKTNFVQGAMSRNNNHNAQIDLKFLPKLDDPSGGGFEGVGSY